MLCWIVLNWIEYTCSIELRFAFLLGNGVSRYFISRLLDVFWVFFGLLIEDFRIVWVCMISFISCDNFQGSRSCVASQYAVP